jgi:hypothetical protein
MEVGMMQLFELSEQEFELKARMLAWATEAIARAAYMNRATHSPPVCVQFFDVFEPRFVISRRRWTLHIRCGSYLSTTSSLRGIAHNLIMSDFPF